jgi:serine/threonine-protein kinase
VGVDSGSGSVVGGFRVGGILGRGATGVVHLSEDAKGQLVALKLLAPELAHDERFRQRFFRESQVAATLVHPHIVRTVAAGEDGGRLYLAMAYIDGVDLRALLVREGALDAERAVRLVRQVGDALDAAHAVGLVHRDVKPGNVLVAAGPTGDHAYVCDFGLARHVSSVGSLTGDRGFVGTIDYVAPEQIRGDALDGRADVYALGCLLFECLTGVRPFERDSELAVVYAHLNEAPPRVTDVRPELPAGFNEVIATALAKAPDDRYITAGGLGRAALASLRGETRPDGPSSAVFRRRRGLLVGLAAAIAAAAAAAVVAVLLTGGRSAPSPAQITPTAIAGAALGLREADYRGLFGIGWTNGVFSGPNYYYLSYPDRRLTVYFPRKGGRAIEITTWEKSFRTAAGIGPCSTIADLKRAYGNALKPSAHQIIRGKVYAYSVGNIVFSANGAPPYPSTRITSVAIYRDMPLGFAAYTTMHEPDCNQL